MRTFLVLLFIVSPLFAQDRITGDDLTNCSTVVDTFSYSSNKVFEKSIDCHGGGFKVSIYVLPQEESGITVYFDSLQVPSADFNSHYFDFVCNSGQHKIRVSSNSTFRLIGMVKRIW